MTDSGIEKSGGTSDSEQSLREEFGLPPLKFESGAPPVNSDLIRALVSNGSISKAEQQRVMDCLDRFQEWRDEYTRIVIDDYRQKKSQSPSSDSPAQGSP